jgi:hypothetical protein
MSLTPWGNDKPERRADRAESHFCSVTGTRLYCPAVDCPHCSQEDADK